MRVTIDKSGRVVLPVEVREKLRFQPGTVLELRIDELGVHLRRPGTSEADARPGDAPPGPELVEEDGRLVARPRAASEEVAEVDFADLVRRERDRWPI